MIEKNSRVEVGKTPAEDSDGKVCKRIVNGTPVYEDVDNCFDKIANLVYKRCDKDDTDEDNTESDKISSTK